METKDILKKLRKNKGYNSAQEFCDVSGISFNTYQNYESGKRIPTTEMLIKLADFYGVTTDYLLGRPEAVAPPNPIEQLDMSQLEKRFIDGYMKLDKGLRNQLMDFMSSFGAAEPEDSPPDYGPFTDSITLGEIEDATKAAHEKGAV